MSKVFTEEEQALARVVAALTLAGVDREDVHKVAGWYRKAQRKPLSEATDNECLDRMRHLDWLSTVQHMTRPAQVEARHILRYVFQDLSGLHTLLEVARPGWEAGALLEINRNIAQLQALMSKLAPKKT